MAQWTDAGYGTERLDLGIVTIAVSYAMDGPKGFEYRYGSFASNRRYPTMGEAKAAAIQSVDMRLAAARREIADMRPAASEPAACEYCGMVHAPHANSLCEH